MTRPGPVSLAPLLCLLCSAGLSGWSSPQVAPRPGAYLQKVRTFHTAEEFARLTRGQVRVHREPRDKHPSGLRLIGSAKGVVVEEPDGSLQPYPADRLLPHHEVTVIAAGGPSGSPAVWIGTKRGLIRYQPDGVSSTIHYFAGKRWLPEDRVTGIGFEPPHTIWVETPQGYSRIEYRPMTLAEKARLFEERVRARHVRHGLTASSHLRVPGDLASNQTVSSDNDGLWTAIYVAEECFRYQVTGESEARDFARQGLQALMRLEAITGIPGLPARSFIKIGEDEQPKDGEWHTTPDGRWRWKGDTSSDEIVGHYFGYSVYYDLVADETEKRQIRAVIERLTSHILDHGYHLIDVDGQPTRWGWWAPEEIWADPDETGLRALHLLSHLRVAHHLTGQPRFQAAYNELVTRHRYHLLTRHQKVNIPGRVNHSDDELAFLSYYPLLRYETDPKLKQIYRESLERSWQVERPERNPLWNYIYAVGTGSGEKVSNSSAEFDAAEARRTLEEIPMDLITWNVANSHRLDVPLDPASDRFNRKQSLLVLPYDELPVMKWNGNPYRLDGGNGGRGEDDGAFFLLPYWLGRYHKLLGQ